MKSQELKNILEGYKKESNHIKEVILENSKLIISVRECSDELKEKFLNID